MTLAQRLATTIVRGWTRTYTWRLPASVRDARRAEIDSDLWEFEHDPDHARGPAALHILARVALGMPDDVSWRVANAPAASRPARIIVLTTATALTLAAFWVYEASRPQPLPLPPGRMAFVAAPPVHTQDDGEYPGIVDSDRL